MAKLSPLGAAVPVLPGLPPPRRGKVRDTYELPEGDFLVVATDRVSIFDFVLDALVPEKGQVLTALNHFWLQMLARYDINHHLVAVGSEVARYLPEGVIYDSELFSRSMVVRRLKMAPIEFIARSHLTGSGLKPYRDEGRVCGQWLPDGLEDGDELPFILDTPTTKAEEGHDEHVDAAAVRVKYGPQTYTLLKAYQIVSDFARRRGIVVADTKLEFGECGTLGDEAFTPDSSRFWLLRDWERSRKAAGPRKAPAAFDKQVVRNWGKGLGIDKLDPLKDEDLASAHALKVPQELLLETTKVYRYILWRLTGRTLEEYFEELGLTFPAKKQRRIGMVVGSESDLDEFRAAFALVSPAVRAKACFGPLHVLSCHRNPRELAVFTEGGCDGVDVLVMAGGKAFQLPGVTDALIHANGNRKIPVVGVALGKPGTKAFEAARLSIEEIPGEPVLLDEDTGGAYCGVEGLHKALERFALGELPPSSARTAKSVQWAVPLEAPTS